MKKLIRIFLNYSAQLKKDNLNSYASSSAFFMFLSFIPMIMLLFSILPYTPIDSNLITNWVKYEFPSGTGEFLISVINEVSERSMGLVFVTAIGTLWSASKGVNSLMTGFNAIDDYVDKRNGFLIRAISAVYTLIFLVGIIALLILLVGGNFIVDHLVVHFPKIANIVYTLMNFRTLISVVLLSVVFMLCYSLLPCRKHRFRETIPGAFISAVAWTGFTYLFSFYVNNFNAYSMYGSLTTIIVILVWLYFCMYILFIGDNLNKYFRPVILALLDKENSFDDVKSELKEL